MDDSPENLRGATYEDLKVDIDRVAKDVARDFVEISWEDVRQELVVFVLVNGKSIKLKENGGNPKWILKKVAQTYCKGQRTEALALSPQYAYRPSDIKLILETAWQGAPKASYVPDDARSPLSKTFNVYDPTESFRVEAIDPFHEPDFVEVASDVKSAMMRIKYEFREAIFNRYVLGIIPDNSSWERKKLNKAINELTLKLNNYRGDTYDRKMRKGISNAGARARIVDTYE